ncbi:MAG: hypothetical protein A2270_10830 [Elusimicrobia bacterium RIFOXYA12_FULL_51_18]|nr:MAG: hypothetical protein A2270_10830 [Elusimicrobia bacterium RIFOXYA12_FULL_51_18]OGS29441.1 MAG: hypothetical protein A2218_00360 [Elusimicrobia bacterium RIFOXYA2_FULL_53_38]
MKDDRMLTFSWMKDGWDATLDNLHYILPAVLAFEVLAVMPALLLWKYFDNRWYALPWEILMGAPLAVGMNLFIVNLVRNGRPDYGDMFRGFTIFPQAVAVSFLYGLIVTAGIIMLVLPGVVWGLAYVFAQYSVIDKKTGIKGSFVRSSMITYGFKERLLPIAMIWVLLEVFTPGIVKAEGSLLHMSLILDLKPWVITAFVLKTLIFMPWLDMIMAKAYLSLLKHYERQPAVPVQKAE